MRPRTITGVLELVIELVLSVVRSLLLAIAYATRIATAVLYGVAFILDRTTIAATIYLEAWQPVAPNCLRWPRRKEAERGTNLREMA